MSACIDFLRHGETQGGPVFRGSLDDPLTLAGLAQMRSAVAGRCWDQVVTSPLRRCAAFAAELAATWSVPMRVDERLREIHFGRWEGRSYAELMAEDAAAVSRFYSDPFVHPPPGGEALVDFRCRVLSAFEDLCDGGGRPLVLTHGGVIRLLLCHLRRWPLVRLLEIEVPLASLHRLEAAGAGQWREVPLSGQRALDVLATSGKSEY